MSPAGWCVLAVAGVLVFGLSWLSMRLLDRADAAETLVAEGLDDRQLLKGQIVDLLAANNALGQQIAHLTIRHPSSPDHRTGRRPDEHELPTL